MNRRVNREFIEMLSQFRQGVFDPIHPDGENHEHVARATCSDWSVFVPLMLIAARFILRVVLTGEAVGNGYFDQCLFQILQQLHRCVNVLSCILRMV